MFKPKYRFTHEEIRIIVMALVELKNSLIAANKNILKHNNTKVVANSKKSGRNCDRFISSRYYESLRFSAVIIILCCRCLSLYTRPAPPESV